jgi:hypothetical protein
MQSPDLPPDLWTSLPSHGAAAAGSSGGLPLALGIAALVIFAVIGFLVGERVPAGERCRITVRRSGARAEFRALVARRLIGRSPAFTVPAAGPIPDDEITRAALDELVDHLRSLGWEPTDAADGAEWYRLRLDQQPVDDRLALPA